METETKIIKQMIDNKKEYTIREIARGLKLDYKIVHTAAYRLLKKKVISMDKVGNSFQLKLLNNFSKDIFDAEFERREDCLRDKNIAVLLQEINKNLREPNLIILLFGSHAKKIATKTSDFDLMFIVPSEKIEKKITEIISVIPLKIHYLVFTSEQFYEMLESRQINVVKEAVKNNVILYGIESYYKILGCLK